MTADQQPASDAQDHADYVVVARRYRPQQFDDLIGQQHVSQALSHAIVSERVGHAYLFTGARGVGKTSAARILAKALNCASGTSSTPCDECEICQSVSSGNDIDVIEIDGASNRGIDEIRQLRQNVAVRPSRARFKIYIIDEVHMLTKEAFNALLKTLEEPPEHVKFIFATTEPNKIPITILSRCQRYDFAGIESGAIRTRLAQIATAEGVAVEEDALQILAMRAAGSMRDSQSLLEQLLSAVANKITVSDVTTMLGIAPAARLSRLVAPLVDRNAAEALAQLHEAVGEGAEVSQLVDQLLGYFRDAMTQAVGCDASQMLHALPDQLQEVGDVADRLGIETLLAIVQILDHTAARMRVSTHARTLAEMAVVRICQLENLDAIADLIAQVKGASGNLPNTKTVKKNKVADPTPPRESRELSGSRPAATQQPTESKRSRPPIDSSSVSQPAPTSASCGVIAQQVELKETEAAPTALSAENVEEIWKRALDSLTGLLVDHAAEADEVLVDPSGCLVIRFSEAFHRDFCERSANRARLEEALTKTCGTAVTLQLETCQRVDAAERPAPKAVSRRQQQADAVAEPFVQKAMELFDGDPSRLRVVNPPAE